MTAFLAFCGFKPFRFWRFLPNLLLLVAIGHVVYYASTTPTHEGPWKPYYAEIPEFHEEESVFHLRNFRRARYDGSGAVTSISWEERSVDLRDLQSVWLGISVFNEPALAHTFLSFDFGDGDPVVVSVEARQRPDQKYDPVKGVYDYLHLIYVLADERDIIGVRTHDRGEKVYFHPLTIEPETMRKLFRDMMQRVRDIRTRPEFYNTLTSNCTNSLLKGAPYSKVRKYLDYRVVLPGFADRAAWAEGILDTRYSLESLQRAALINPSGYSPDQPNMSAFLRSEYYRRLGQEAML